MERRGFLSFLGLGVAGAMLPDVIKIAPHLFNVDKVSPDIDPVNIQSLTEAVSLEFERIYRPLMGYTCSAYGDGMKVGDELGVLGGLRVTLDSQCSTYMSPPEKVEGLHERYIAPLAKALARECERSQMDVFAPLKIPHLGPAKGEGFVVNTGRTAIRGILHSYYDPGWDAVITNIRFDALGGHTLGRA